MSNKYLELRHQNHVKIVRVLSMPKTNQTKCITTYVQKTWPTTKTFLIQCNYVLNNYKKTNINK